MKPKDIVIYKGTPVELVRILPRDCWKIEDRAWAATHMFESWPLFTVYESELTINHGIRELVA